MQPADDLPAGADRTSHADDEPAASAARQSTETPPPTASPTRSVQRLEPRVRVLWLIRVAILVAIVGILGAGIVTVVNVVPVWVVVVIAGGLGLIGAVLVQLRFHRWRFELREDALYLERGVITQVRTVVPYVRVQHVDASRGPLERATGLARSVVYTAGSRGADVTIPGLTPARADDLQERLKEMAVASGGDDGV